MLDTLLHIYARSECQLGTGTFTKWPCIAIVDQVRLRMLHHVVRLGYWGVDRSHQVKEAGPDFASPYLYRGMTNIDLVFKQQFVDRPLDTNKSLLFCLSDARRFGVVELY
jgi:hypothetical protein